MKGYRVNQINIIIGTIMMILCIVTCILYSGYYREWNYFKKISDPVKAVITKIDSYYSGDTRYYDVYISYEYNGLTYDNTLNYHTSTMHKGDTVDIRVSRTDPHVIKNSLGDTKQLLIFAIFLGIIGWLFLLHELLSYFRARHLIDQDMYVICDKWTEINSRYSVNDVYQKCILAVYEANGDRYEFTSRPYPPGECPVYKGESVTVYVDIERAPKKYYVALSDT